MTESQSPSGLAELKRITSWNIPRRRRNARILVDALKTSPLVKYFPVDTPERQNGWYVLAFSLDVENMKCDVKEFVAAVSAGGAPVWEGFLPQFPTGRAFQADHAF